MPAPACPAPPSSERKRAFRRGVLTTIGALVIGPVLLVVTGRLGLLQGQTNARLASTLILLGSLATAWIGLSYLRRTRDGQWDGLAVLALAVMATAFLTLLMFAALLALLWLGGSWLE